MSEQRQTNPSIKKQAEKRAQDRKATADQVKDYLLPASHPWANGAAIAGGVGVVALGAAAAMGWNNPRFAFSYLFAFLVFLSIALGSLFFVMIQHLTSAGWSVTMRRTAEFFMAGIVVMALLFVPVWAKRATLFPWLRVERAATTETTAAGLQTPSPPQADEHEGSQNTPGTHAAAGEPGTSPHSANVGGPPEGVGERRHEARHGGDGHGHGSMKGGAGATTAEMAEDKALEDDEQRVLLGKKAYLNEGLFTGRAVLYFGLWSLIALMLFRYSTSQDVSKDPQLTVKAQRFTPPMTPVFALTLTFAAFDWIMSLEPSWFSTIFGVYYFAGCVLGGFSTLILATLAIRRTGLLRTEINVEHYHDIGKLLFGFLVFWAYIGFAQFMLIWYAAIPEETTFFHHRWDEGPWKNFSLFLVFGNFVIPFFLLISRNTKRKLGALAIGSAWVLVAHVVDVYWLVMPNFAQANFAFDVLDILCLVGVGGVYLAAVLAFMRRNRLIPVGDPRLLRALRFENA